MKPQTKNIFSRLILITTLLIFSVSAMGQRTQTAKSAKRGAGWGALAGLVFGGSVWDVASAKRAYQRIVAQDDTVSSLDEAKEETIDALVDVRADRKNAGIQCKA